MIEPAHLVAVGGALGAVCRYQLSQWLAHDRLPVGTFTVNVVGSLLLGLIIGAGGSEHLVLFVGIGFCGAFTTYSSFSFETVRLWENGARLRATLYAVGTFSVCLLGYGLGWGSGAWLIQVM